MDKTNKNSYYGKFEAFSNEPFNNEAAIIKDFIKRYENYLWEEHMKFEDKQCIEALKTAHAWAHVYNLRLSIMNGKLNEIFKEGKDEHLQKSN